MNYLVQKTTENINGNIILTSSKSESNRVLIIKALQANNFEINNLSTSDDTQTLIKLLGSSDEILDVGPAGTTLRFLISYFACQKGITKTLTGSKRMLERPIKDLVDALECLGADIEYLKNVGYPPLKIHGSELNGYQVNISGSISSQYITSLILIAPTLKNGLKINIENKIASKPYINMTMKILNYFGVKAYWEDNSIIIPHKKYENKPYTIEGDWSSASYLYEILAFAKSGEIAIHGLKENSLQGDSVIASIMSNFGIETEFNSDGLTLRKNTLIVDSFTYDFSDCPDIAQTVAVVCSGLGINAKLTGLESLKIKETNRVHALINELSKLGVEIFESEENTLEIKANKKTIKENVLINTYKDHRMAMAFAPLSLICNSIIIEEPEVVKKSYPEFWNDINNLGLTFQEV